jgi:uncharacterized membrane protein SirB2
MYIALKHSHLLFVFLTLALFVLRGIWLFTQSPLLQKKIAKILPHVFSLFLLVSGVAVSVLLGFSPSNQPWILAKLIALVVFIALGIITFKAANKSVGKISWVSALAVYAYIISVAITKTPLGFFG